MNYTSYLMDVEGSKLNDMVEIRDKEDPSIEDNVTLFNYVMEFAKVSLGLNTDDPTFQFTELEFQKWYDTWVISTMLEELRRKERIEIVDSENIANLPDEDIVWKLKK